MVPERQEEMKSVTRGSRYSIADDTQDALPCKLEEKKAKSNPSLSVWMARYGNIDGFRECGIHSTVHYVVICCWKWTSAFVENVLEELSDQQVMFGSKLPFITKLQSHCGVQFPFSCGVYSVFIKQFRMLEECQILLNIQIQTLQCRYQ